MVKTWWEIKILSDPALEDTIFWRLEKFGARGMSSESKGDTYLIRSYLPSIQFELLDLAALSLFLRQDALIAKLPVPMVQWDLIDEQDWASSWKDYWQPQEVGDRFLIYPAWLTPPEQSDRLILRLDPGAAFGTGTHQTTQLCLEALEMRLGAYPISFLGVQPTQTQSILADIGCGSGILSIGAILLGAHKVYAVDIDPLAVQAAKANRKLNHINPSTMLVEQGDMRLAIEMAQTPVDGIICNIIAEVIIDIIPQMEKISKPSTWGIISGILVDQAKPIADTLEQHGWIVATLWKRQEWCCFNIRRQN